MPDDQSQKFDFWKEYGDKGLVVAVVLAVGYFGGQFFKTDEGKKAAPKAAKTGWKMLVELKDSLIDPLSEVGKFGREVGRIAFGFIRRQNRARRNERRYREGLGVSGHLRRAASPVPGWLDTAVNAHRHRRNRGN